jgi:glucose-6-phosphate-specific signal transduction histidine kinase
MNNFSISKSGGKIFMSLVMLSIFGIMVGMATQYPPQARFMPFIVGIPGIVSRWKFARRSAARAATITTTA